MDKNINAQFYSNIVSISWNIDTIDSFPPSDIPMVEEAFRKEFGIENEIQTNIYLIKDDDIVNIMIRLRDIVKRMNIAKYIDIKIFTGGVIDPSPIYKLNNNKPQIDRER